jgi:hypothetical protein
VGQTFLSANIVKTNPLACTPFRLRSTIGATVTSRQDNGAIIELKATYRFAANRSIEESGH